MQHFSQIMSIQTYCINFYGIELWSKYRKTTLLRITASYVKCIKMFFNFERLDSVHAMFQELGLPTFNTLMHNAKA